MKNIHMFKSKLNVATFVMLFLFSTLTASAYAQSQNSQASTLFEVQALREEVAQLRDMVERQQYELRKMQRQMNGGQSQTKASQNETNDGQKTASVLSRNTVVSQPAEQTESLADIASASANINDSVEQTGQPVILESESAALVNDKIPATVISSRDSIGTVESSSNGRVYPPVVEVNIGDSDSKATVSADSINRNVESVQLVESLSSVDVGASNIETRASEAIGTVTSYDDLSILDIKPVETISSKSVVSIPNTIKPEASINENAVTSAQAVSAVISEDDYYQQGFELLKQSKYDDAVTVFQQQIKSYPKGSLADDAYYWVGESMYVNRKLDISKENFKAIVQNYPNSERAPDAMLKLAYIEQEQGNIIEARILLQEIIQYHPNSDAALSAKNRLSEIN